MIRIRHIRQPINNVEINRLLRTDLPLADISFADSHYYLYIILKF